MADLFRFRCFQCQKLIGAPPSKFGKVVNCPTCGVELIVPSPEAEGPPPAEPDADAFRPEDLGIDFGIERLAPPPASSASTREPDGPNPIAFLETVSEAVEDPAPEFPNEPNPDADHFPNEPNESGEVALPEPRVEPLVGRGRGPRVGRSYEPSSRARDVVLPRTAATAWAMFALLGLACAFTAGLMIGHFLWK